MSSFRKLSLEAFFNELASKKPTPGGGTAAALAAALSASLIEMVSSLTVGKKSYEKVSRKMAGIGKKAKEAKESLLRMADEDAKAFDAVLASYRNKDEKKGDEALKKATEIPLAVASQASLLIGLAQETQLLGNKNAVSDAKVARHLAKAAATSALENVKINLKGIKDIEFKKTVEKSIRRLK